MSEKPLLTRRAVGQVAAAALAAPALLRWSSEAIAAAGVLKFAHGMEASHPAHTNIVAAVAKIAEDTKGALTVKVFPNGQLGGDDELLAQVRSGAVDLTLGVPAWFTSNIPECASSSLPFVFSNYDQCWAAWDGDFGDHIRSLISGIGVTTAKTTWDLGFRDITSNVKPVTTVDDLRGLKIRLPGNPLSIALFKTFGSSPVVIELQETYSALQSHLVDAQENSLVSINATKLQEVQKYCSTTNHVWNGLWIFGSSANLSKLPEEHRKILFDRFDEAGLNQRREMAALSSSLRKKLSDGGLIFNDPSQDSFKAALKSAGFYTDWKAKIGDQTWAMLEKYTGPLG